MRVVRLLLFALAASAAGCAAWPERAPSALPAQPNAPDPFRRGDPLPVLPDPAAWVWPRVELGQAVPTPPETVIVRSPAVVPTTTTSAVGTPETLPRQSWRSEFESTDRRPIQTAVLGSGAEHVLVTGSLSGNDPTSVRLLDALLATLARQPDLLDGREAVLVRNPHPDGLVEHISVNARGVDLNRNFPSARFTASPTRETGPHPASEAETRVLLRLLGDAKPSRVIHIRAGHGDRILVTGNAACLELLAQLRNDFSVDISTFDGEFKAGSLEEFAATRLKAQVLVIEFPEAVSQTPRTADLLAAAVVSGRKLAPTTPEIKDDSAPVAAQPSTSPAALTGAVEQAGPDGEKGYVELLPPPPNTDSATPITESRYYELPPP